MFLLIFGRKLFLRIAGKIGKIGKIRNFVPNGTSSLFELFLFC